MLYGANFWTKGISAIPDTYIDMFPTGRIAISVLKLPIYTDSNQVERSPNPINWIMLR